MPGIGPIAASPIGRDQVMSILVGRTATAEKSSAQSIARTNIVARGSIRNAGAVNPAALHEYLQAMARHASGNLSKITVSLPLNARSITKVGGQSSMAMVINLVGRGAMAGTARVVGRLAINLSGSGSTRVTGSLVERLTVALTGRGATQETGIAAERVMVNLSGRGTTQGTGKLAQRLAAALTGRGAAARSGKLTSAVGTVNLTGRSSTSSRMGLTQSGAMMLVARGWSGVVGAVAPLIGSVGLSGQGGSAEQSRSVIGGTVQITAIQGSSAAGAQGGADMSAVAMLQSASATAVRGGMTFIENVFLTAASWAMVAGGASIGVQDAFVYLTSSSSMAAGGRVRGVFAVPLSAASAVMRFSTLTFEQIIRLVASSWHATMGQVQSLDFAIMPNVTPGRYVVNCDGRVRVVSRTGPCPPLMPGRYVANSHQRVRTVYRTILSQEPCDC
jgi:hypothetical protein